MGGKPAYRRNGKAEQDWTHQLLIRETTPVASLALAPPLGRRGDATRSLLPEVQIGEPTQATGSPMTND
ncbi:hypothetical protein [Nostoc sp.]|uniref:hypothetical protein n=1 Tax=Nostoc sp. TaxID=1180 RepID=UPI002FF80E29